MKLSTSKNCEWLFIKLIVKYLFLMRSFVFISLRMIKNCKAKNKKYINDIKMYKNPQFKGTLLQT